MKQEAGGKLVLLVQPDKPVVAVCGDCRHRRGRLGPVYWMCGAHGGKYVEFVYKNCTRFSPREGLLRRLWRWLW